MTQKILYFSIVIITILVSVSAVSVAAVQPQMLLIPAYFYPGKIWTNTLAVVTSQDVVIFNPNSGPGNAIDIIYQDVVSAVSVKGVVPTGYVSTAYGLRDLSAVKADIDKYFNWYGVQFIFVDETAGSSACLAYYSAVYDYIETRGCIVIINPGCVPAEAYMAISDIAVIFEGSYKTYRGAQFPSWIQRYPSTKICHLVYDCSSSNLSNAFTLSRQRNSGFVYITNDKLPNPWDTIASYIGSEKSKLSGSTKMR